MSKTFTVAGTSFYNGKTRLRFSNDLDARKKTLDRNGDTDAILIELATPMTNADACALMLEHEDFQGEAEQSAITSYVVKNAKDLAKELGLVEDKPAAEATDEAGEDAGDVIDVIDGGETVESVEEFDPS